MSLASGKKGTITHRDNELFDYLFFCNVLTEAQIADALFDSRSCAHKRLYKLKEKGYLENDRFHPAPMHWYLSKAARARQAGYLGLTGVASEGQEVGPGRMEHYLDTNDLFVRIKQPLDEILGPYYPEWEWLSERRAYESFTYGSAEYRHQPDAQVRFSNRIFIVERQTDRARMGTTRLSRRIEDHRVYINYFKQMPDSIDVVFACDKPADAAAAERIGNDIGVHVVADTVGEIAAYIIAQAEEEARYAARA